MDLDDIRQILDLVREHDLAELEIERDGLKVRVRKAAAEAQATVAAPGQGPLVVTTDAGAQASSSQPPTAAEPAAPAEGVDLAVIKSPIVGTFYRSPEPGASPFVDVGAPVKKGQVLCIIEAMKLMNEIESDCDGELAAVYVENGRPVQFGERLFAIKVR